MMSKNEKIKLIMTLNNEVDVFVNEVKNFIPSLLAERYQVSSVDHTDTLLSIVDLEKHSLEKDIRKVYAHHLTDEALDELIILCSVQDKVEIDSALYDALEDAKNFWFDSFIFKADIIMDQIRDGDFSN